MLVYGWCGALYSRIFVEKKMKLSEVELEANLDAENTRICICIDETLKKNLLVLAKSKGMPLSEYLNQVLTWLVDVESAVD